MSGMQKAALGISFVVTSAVGAGFVFEHWSAAGAPAVGAGRGVAFVVMMACVHAVGWRLYQLQAEMQMQVAGHTGGSIPASLIGEAFAGALRAAAVQSVALLTLTALLLDGGMAFRVVLIAAVAHWACTGWIFLRRADRPTPADLMMIRYGLLPLAVTAGWLAHVLPGVAGF